MTILRPQLAVSYVPIRLQVLEMLDLWVAGR